MIVYDACPCCGQQNISKVLIAEDHTVSHELFEIWHCNSCTARFTQHIPGENEIDRYYQSPDYISHSDTNKGLVNKLYHLIRKKTLLQKRRLVEKYTKKNTGAIADVGAGTGAFLHTMCQAGWEVSGFEPDATARAKAINLYNLQLETPDDLFSVTNESLDAVTLWHVLEHVHKLHEYVVQLKKILKPSGKLFIAVPNYTSYDAKKYAASWAAYDVPRHLYHFSSAAMQQLLSKYDMKIDCMKPMWFDSFYVSILSEKYATGKSNMLKAIINGIASNIAAAGNTAKCSSVIYIISKK